MAFHILTKIISQLALVVDNINHKLKLTFTHPLHLQHQLKWEYVKNTLLGKVDLGTVKLGFEVIHITSEENK